MEIMNFGSGGGLGGLIIVYTSHLIDPFLHNNKNQAACSVWLHFFACRSSAVRFSVAAWFGFWHSLYFFSQKIQFCFLRGGEIKTKESPFLRLWIGYGSKGKHIRTYLYTSNVQELDQVVKAIL
jgi:hypothetical protein